jgi:hypothetical protein|tara:strand:+ start:3039 stop:3626 length:588 start_codon:yes stop_codon:yes gene_type:complete
MSLLKRAADFAYTLRFITLLTTPFNKTKAFELGLIDEKGKRDRKVKLDTDAKKSAYTLFIRVVFNIKRLIAKVSGGDRVIGNLAAGLLLMKENYGVNEKDMEKVLKKLNIDTLDFMTENTEWFVTENKMLSPGVYTVRNEKIINSSFEEIVKKNDKIRVNEDCYPKGDIFGLDVYEVLHINSNQPIYVTLGELNR